MAIRSRFPTYVDAITAPVGRAIARTHITPNWLTTFGIVLTAAAGVAVGLDRPVLGGLILIAGGLMDTFDGAVARATGRSTPFGGFYDSVSDRISDGLILAAMAYWVRDEPRLFVLAVTALVAAEVTSYVRAKAESIDLDCSVGVLERAERAVLLIIALLFHRWLLEPVLWLLAVGGVFTVVQRIHHVWCQIDRDIPEELLALALLDRAWSRAFKRAARRFYGERNFDPALDEHSNNSSRNAADTSDDDSALDPNQRARHASTAPDATSPAHDATSTAPDATSPAPDHGSPAPEASPGASDDVEGAPSRRVLSRLAGRGAGRRSTS